jgi:hypothetical protein
MHQGDRFCLSVLLRKTYTARLKSLHEQEHPKSKGGRPSKTVPKAGKVSKPERFTKAHAKRTGRSEAAVQQDVAEATALGDDVMKKIVGTSLDKPWTRELGSPTCSPASLITPSRTSISSCPGTGSRIRPNSPLDRCRPAVLTGCLCTHPVKTADG